MHLILTVKGFSLGQVVAAQRTKPRIFDALERIEVSLPSQSIYNLYILDMSQAAI
jgi:hypothetical protein